jgi:hypothetical protein
MLTSIGLETMYKNGDKCPRTGFFQFSGYLDGSRTPLPREDEMLLHLEENEIFPPIYSSSKDCLWRML